MENYHTIIRFGVLIVFTILFCLLLIPILENFQQSIFGGIILSLFYVALTDLNKKTK